MEFYNLTQLNWQPITHWRNSYNVLRWLHTISHLFLHICCIVDGIVHFVWIRGWVNNYPHSVCGIYYYQFKKKIVYYATRAYSITLHTSARRSPECVKKYAWVAYVILCNSVCKVRHNECTHGDEKPPPPIRDGRVYRGKERMYGGKERVQGRRGPRVILGVNSSYSGSHLPSQYGSNPSGGTQTMLILLRPLFPTKRNQ